MLRRLWIVLLLILAGCTSAPAAEPVIGEDDPPAPPRAVWINASEPDSAFRVEIEPASGECSATLRASGTVGSADVHQFLYVEQNESFSGVMVGFNLAYTYYVDTGAGAPVLTDRSEGTEWNGELSFGDAVGGGTYAVTAYLMGADAGNGTSGLHVQCTDPFVSHRVLRSAGAGIIGFAPEAGTALMPTGHGFTMDRHHEIPIEEQGHIHLLVDEMYGPLSLRGPNVDYDVQLSGTPRFPHFVVEPGTYELETPALARDADRSAMLALAYGGFLPTDAYEIGEVDRQASE